MDSNIVICKNSNKGNTQNLHSSALNIHHPNHFYMISAIKNSECNFDKFLSLFRVLELDF